MSSDERLTDADMIYSFVWGALTAVADIAADRALDPTTHPGQPHPLDMDAFTRSLLARLLDHGVRVDGWEQSWFKDRV